MYCICARCDFRKAFSKLGGLRALTNAPFMALTASAPSHIESQICHSLHLKKPVVVSQPLDRRNNYILFSKRKCCNKGEVIHSSLILLEYSHYRAI